MRIHHHLVVAFLACTVRLAAADDAAKAAEHVTAAKKAFAEAHYTEAIAEFRAANALQPDPKLLYSIAQAQRMAGDCAAAIGTYDEFIKASTDDKLVEFSRANIARCKEQIASQPKPVRPKEVVAPPPVKEPVAPIAPQPEPQPQPTPEPPQPQPIDKPAAPSWTRDWLGHALVGGGVGLGVAGTVVWIGGRSAAQATKDASDHQTFLDKRDAASSAVTKQRVGIVMGLAGIGLVAGGVVHYKLRGKHEARVAIVPTGDGGAVIAGGALLMRAAWLAVVLAGCVSPASVFTCDTDEQCNGGTCQPATHFCSFANPACESGQSYDDAAGGLSGECVPFDGPPAVCGNGMVEQGEDCEDGNQDATDDCADCHFAKCGDGHVRAGIEECDDGNTADGDACNSICLDCDAGDASVVVNGRCYMRFDTADDLLGALGDCGARDGILATITSAADNDALVSLLPAASVYWVGLSDGPNSTLVWSDDEVATFTNLAPGQPSANPVQCWTINQATGQWSDADCFGAVTFPYVCERRPWTIEPTTRHAYRFIGNGASKQYTPANDDCVQRGGHLVSILDANEQAVVDAVTTASHIWIGLNDTAVPNTFEWTSGEALTGFFNWGAAEPDASGTCVTKRADGTWSDETCTPQFGQSFVCEIDP